MSASSTPTTTMLCASWATVVANAPARSPKPRTSPSPTRPVAWWRSMTAILARSRSGSATTLPSRERGVSHARAGDELARQDLDHPHPLRACPAMRERDRHRAHRVAQLGRRDSAGDVGHAPVLSTSDDAERLEVVEQHEVGDVARRDRAAVGQPVGARAVQRGHHQHVLGRDALARPRSGTSGRCGPRDRGSRARGRRCRTRSSPGRARAPAAAAREVARVGGLADQHPHARAGASPAPRRR